MGKSEPLSIVHVCSCSSEADAGKETAEQFSSLLESESRDVCFLSDPTFCTVFDGPGRVNMFRVPYDVEAWGKLGSPFSSVPIRDDRQYEEVGSLIDSTKSLEPKEDVFSECLAEITGQGFKTKGDGEKKTWLLSLYFTNGRVARSSSSSSSSSSLESLKSL
jgi:hypothetical protein